MSAPRGATSHPRQGTVTIRGCSFVYREAGEGAPVLFVHGTLAGMDTFRRQLLWFGHRARAIAYSRRFHPPSGSGHAGGVVSTDVSSGAVGSGGVEGAGITPTQYRLDEHAADMIAFVDVLGLGRPHIVASSYGAYVAIRACLMEPSLASSLVAAEPPMLRLLELTPQGNAALERFRTLGLDPARQAFDRGDLAGGAAHFFDGIRAKPGAFHTLTDLQRADLVRFAPALQLELTSDFDLFMPHIPLERLNELRIPTLLLSGELSPALFHIVTDAVRPAIPGAQLTSIPSADHSIHTSAPAAFNEAVWEFISAHS